MNIIERLKKEKKGESVLDSLIKKKEVEEEKKEGTQAKPKDLEIREITHEKPPLSEAEMVGAELKSERPTKEFRTEGMHEFDIESLGASNELNIKAKYKSKITTLIDESKIDEAMILLQELKEKLAKI